MEPIKFAMVSHSTALVSGLADTKPNMLWAGGKLRSQMSVRSCFS